MPHDVRRRGVMHALLVLVIGALAALGAGSAGAAPTVTMHDLGTFFGPDMAVYDFNDAGLSVGQAGTQPADSPNAFVATSAGGIVNIGGLGTAGDGRSSSARAVSENGTVVGYSTLSGDGSVDGMHAFRWTEADGFDDLGTLGGLTSYAMDVNDAGMVVGASALADNVRTYAFVWTEAGGMVDLGILPGATCGNGGCSEAYAVNESGQVVGVSKAPGGGRHAFLWTEADGMIDLGTLGGFQSTPTAINANGQVVGNSDISSGTDRHAFTWTQAGGMVDLGALAPAGNSNALGLNDAGQVVGYVPNGLPNQHRPFVWSQTGGMVNLGLFPDGTGMGEANDINDSGQVVGSSDGVAYARRAFVWTPATGLVDLGSLDPESDTHAYRINETGQIAGWGFPDYTFWSPHAVIWDVADLGGFSDGDGDGVADALDSGSGAFTDAIAGQPDTAGHIVSTDAGLTVQIEDAPDPDGVTVTVGPGSGRVTLSLCGGAFTARVYAGSTAVLTCGSLTERVVTGQAEIVFGSTVVTIPAGVTAKVTDNPGGLSVANLGGGDVTVTTGGVPSTLGPNATTTIVSDTTPPVVTPAVTGTLGNNGWYRSAVGVTWAVGDAQSAVSSQTGCGAATVSSDTAGVTFTCVATSAGGTTTKSVTVKRDATVPNAAYAAHPATYTVAQTVAFACTSSDARSGIATSCQSVDAPAYSFAPGVVTLTGSATDLAGNTRTITTTFTVSVTGASLCTLTKTFVHGSAKYLAATKLQKAAADLVVTAGCVAANAVKPNMTAKQKLPLLTAYKAAVKLLATPGWMTAAQGGKLTSLSNAL